MRVMVEFIVRKMRRGRWDRRIEGLRRRDSERALENNEDYHNIPMNGRDRIICRLRV
jgi:hypothetical protein